MQLTKTCFAYVLAVVRNATVVLMYYSCMLPSVHAFYSEIFGTQLRSVAGVAGHNREPHKTPGVIKYCIDPRNSFVLFTDETSMLTKEK